MGSCSADVAVCEPIAAGDEGLVGILFGGRRSVRADRGAEESVVGFLFGGRRGVRVGRRAVAGDLLPVTCLTCH